ncbi:glycosyltransferase family 2 protein [Mesoterricola silvestris]|uniref:Glycosyltransferase 2-like domain-containing protein n=1 Tax=Mesoterricola silvestris TaxID=2927979 RepID=A0AA48GEF2_9BACT|nr:glycosyltransferase [Mesoterricola silvestris]BDU71021.1 hypothetical protein METEAL_01950 [Mesoterricola silvestris]
MTPRLSVVMPTFNRTRWLGEAMDRILEPGLDLELVVLDNGSSDGTWACLQRRAAEDPRVRPVRWESNNPAEAYPALLEMARGEYVNLFADDDWPLPGGLARKMALLDAHPETAMVFSTARCMNERGEDLGEADWTRIADEDFTGRSDLFDLLFARNYVPMPAALFRRALAPAAILRDPFFGPSHDWPFWLDLARRAPIAFLREPTVSLRLHGSQVSSVIGFGQGFFLEVNFNVWRRWMLETSPPFVPSSGAWKGMCLNLAGLLRATHGQDLEKVQAGLRRLYALRDEQEAMLAGRRDEEEAGFPEAFLLGTRREDWRGIVTAYGNAFTPEDPVLLAILPEPQEDPEALAGAVRAADGGPAVRVLGADQVLGALRAFPHIQWVDADSGSTLQGAKGRRLAEAMRQLGGQA